MNAIVTGGGRAVAAGLLAALAVVSSSCGPGSSGGGGSSATSQGPARITRGPQVALVTETSVAIAWLSSKPAVGAVEYGLDPDLGSSIVEPSATREHVASLAGLAPSTPYFYRVLLDGAPVSEGHRFATAQADPATPFRFDVFADLGSGPPQAGVAAAVLASDPTFAILPGDIVYESGSPREIDPRYFVPYAHLIDHIPFYPALGNHDVVSLGGQPLLDALYLPENDQDGTERFYSFDWADAHFIALDSNDPLQPGSTQATWLERDLSRAAATWTFVYFHHPPFSSSRHGSSLDVRQSLEPVFDAHHVDVVFSGHDHDYERTFPLRAAQLVDQSQDPDYVDPQGTIYIVTGGGGKDLYASGRSYFTAFSRSIHHFTQVDVSGHELTISAILPDGSVLDRITIRKTPPP